MSEPRRFQVHYGTGSDRTGYVVTDSSETDEDWRGRVVFATDSRSEAEAEAEVRNLREGERAWHAYDAALEADDEMLHTQECELQPPHAASDCPDR